MKVHPIRDHILVKRKEELEVSPGGIVIAPTAREKPTEGEVLAVGTGKISSDGTLIPLEVAVGDVILFNKFSGTEIKVGNEDYLILKEDNILCVLK